MPGLRREDRWPVDDIRSALQSSGLSLSLICRRLGWVSREGKAETAKLSRVVGLTPQTSGYTNRNMHYDNAVAIARALDRDPVDLGL